MAYLTGVPVRRATAANLSESRYSVPSERSHDYGRGPLPVELDRDGAVILAGDSVEVLPRLRKDLVDAVVTDPPYGLEFNGHDWDGKAGFAESLPGVDLTGMSDPEVFEAWCTAWARGALQALKPGAHLAAFGGSRTWHRMVRGIENAGFEVRDQIAWLYSSGMPKSMDLGYALDKRNGIRRPDRIVQQSDRDGVLGATRRVVQHGAAVSEDAQRWEGWGTALRPSFEPIVIARKPMIGTVADNVLQHGTGAIHIDAARFGEGKWPANAVLDDSQADALDLLTGSWRVDPVSSRFPVFRYEQKAPGTERPRAFGISHSTVKPLSLMRWLIRLLTPPGGLVLEPFAGSGSTVEAALQEHVRVVAIEKDVTFLPLIASRIDRVALDGAGA